MPIIKSITPVVDGLSVYRPNQPIAWNVHINEPGLGTRVSFVIRNWKGEVKQERQNLRVSDADLRIVCNVSELGWFELTVILLDSTGRVLDKKTSTFTIEPQTHSSGRYFHYAISSHTAHYSGTEFDNEIRLLADSGADIVRTDLNWGTIQPGPNTWNYQSMDKVVDALAAHQIEVQGILDYTARWATTDDPNDKDINKWSRVAPKLDPYVAFATTSVNHYKGRIRFWEIWNEPDIGFWQSPTEKYVELFNTTSKAIKQANPDTLILNGGFAMVIRQPNPNFIHDFLNGVDTTHWDIWAYHDYQTFSQMLSRNREHQQLYRSKGISIPTWINEGGFHDLNAGGENEQALTLAKKYTTAPALGVNAYFWYDLRDDGVNPKEPEDHFGLVKHDFSPKPAFAAFQVVVDQLANRKFEKQLTDVPAGVFAHLYRGGDASADNVLALWREGKNHSTPMWLDLPAVTTSAYDMMGNLLPSISYASGLLLNIDDAPLYLHFPGSRVVPQIKPILSTPDKVVLASGAPSELSIQILNPSKFPTKVAMSLQSNIPGITFVPSKQKLTIAPNQSAIFSTKASISMLVNSASGTVTVRSLATGSTQAIEAVIPYSTALVIPRLRTASSGTSISPGEGLSLTLSDRDHIHNLFNAEPSPEMHWHGSEDLSATTRIACDDSALYFEVTARDNVHYQPYHKEALWQGDSLQFMIRTTDTQTDYLEAMVALVGDGSAEGWVFSKPVSSRLELGRMGDKIPTAARREGDRTIYSVRMPWLTLGLSSAPVDGFRFNFIVNDNDGKGRKQWVRISPGMGDEINPEEFNVFICR